MIFTIFFYDSIAEFRQASSSQNQFSLWMLFKELRRCDYLSFENMVVILNLRKSIFLFLIMLYFLPSILCFKTVITNLLLIRNSSSSSYSNLDETPVFFLSLCLFWGIFENVMPSWKNLIARYSIIHYEYITFNSSFSYSWPTIKLRRINGE